MLLELAQSPDGPVRLITGEPPQSAQHVLPLWLGLAIISLIIAGGLLVWAAITHRAAREANPSEYAFRALARRMRLSARHAALVRRLAAGVQCAPVAILVSDHAFRAAAMCFERTSPSKRDLALLNDLLGA